MFMLLYLKDFFLNGNSGLAHVCWGCADFVPKLLSWTVSSEKIFALPIHQFGNQDHVSHATENGSDMCHLCGGLLS